MWSSPSERGKSKTPEEDETMKKVDAFLDGLPARSSLAIGSDHRSASRIQKGGGFVSRFLSVSRSGQRRGGRTEVDTQSLALPQHPISALSAGPSTISQVQRVVSLLFPTRRLFSTIFINQKKNYNSPEIDVRRRDENRVLSPINIWLPAFCRGLLLHEELNRRGNVPKRLTFLAGSQFRSSKYQVLMNHKNVRCKNAEESSR